MVAASMRRALAGALAGLIMALTPASASAAIQTFGFVLPDFAVNPSDPADPILGYVLGYFNGSDDNGDGVLLQNGVSNEVTDFGAAFFTPDGKPTPLIFTYADLQNGGLAYYYTGTFGDTGSVGPSGIIATATIPGFGDATLATGAFLPCNGDVCSGIFDQANTATGLFSVAQPGVFAAPGAPAPLLGLGLLPALVGAAGIAATRRRRRRHPALA